MFFYYSTPKKRNRPVKAVPKEAGGSDYFRLKKASMPKYSAASSSSSSMRSN